MANMGRGKTCRAAVWLCCAFPFLLMPDQDLVRPAVRDARSIRFNSRYGFSMLEQAPGRVSKPVTIVDFAGGPELPFETTDAIVAGEVTRIQSFLSADKKQIYTEYTIKVTEVVKAGVGTSPAPGDSLTLLGLGGTLRVSDGRVLEHSIHNNIVPALHQRYLFFLLHAPALEAFYYEKFWLIDQGVLKPVFPQDVALARDGQSVHAGKPIAEVIAFLKSASH